MTIVGEEIPDRDRENEGGKGAGPETMRGRERDIKTEDELDETGEIAYNAAGVKAEAGVEIAIELRKVCQTSNFARFPIILFDQLNTEK